jgi:hypothetical protein
MILGIMLALYNLEGLSFVPADSPKDGVNACHVRVLTRARPFGRDPGPGNGSVNMTTNPLWIGFHSK